MIVHNISKEVWAALPTEQQNAIKWAATSIVDDGSSLWVRHSYYLHCFFCKDETSRSSVGRSRV